MRTRFTAALLALLVVGGLVAASSPAQAVNYTFAEVHCVSWHPDLSRDAEVCLTVGWRTQDDGTGIRVEDVKWGGTCAEFESTNPFRDPYVHAAPYYAAGGPGPVDNPLYAQCRVWRDVEMKVDANRVTIQANTDVRVDNAPDKTVWFEFDICQHDDC